MNYKECTKPCAPQFDYCYECRQKRKKKMNKWKAIFRILFWEFSAWSKNFTPEEMTTVYWRGV